MPFIETGFQGLVLFEPTIWPDSRGYFFESYNAEIFKKQGIYTTFVQDNQAKSSFGVLRGLHYQVPPFDQAKLVRVLEGEVLDIALDLRPDSETFGRHYSVRLSAHNKLQMFIPRGFAHGYVVLSESAEFFYKCDNFYSKAHEAGVRYNDPMLAIDWQVSVDDLIVSDKDKMLPFWGQHL